MASFARALLEGYYRLLRFLLTVLMAAMIVPVSLQILSRFTDLIPRYIWTEEVARFCFVWIIMVGSAVAVRDATHFDVDLLPHPKTDRSKGIGKLIVHLAMMFFALLFVRYGIEFGLFGVRQMSEVSEINMLSIYISFPIAGITWALFLAEHLVQDVRLITQEQSGETSESHA